MLRLIPIIFFIAISRQLAGQPVIETAVLPAVGDTLSMASDNLPEYIAILGEGPNQEWDFTSLQSAFTQKIAVQSTKSNKRNKGFKKANLVIEEVAGIKSYFKKDNHSLALMGMIGLDPLNMGVQTTTYFEKPINSLHFPLKYKDESEQEGQFSFTLSAADLPRDVLYTLPITPDSVRYRCFVKQHNKVDAWGTLALPDNTYYVLREKRIEERSYEVDIKVGNLPWQDITKSVEDAKIQNKQIVESYHFYTNETTSKVAVAYMKPNGVNPEFVSYTVVNPSTNTRHANGHPDIYAYPNPAINDVRFEFSNLKPSIYTLKIYNILGVVVREEDYKLSGFKTVKLDISKLKKGTYLYSLSDAKGKTVATRRLMVIRP
jgi:hypothetical protein